MKYNVLGIMSGTSMDGVDLALCEIREEAGQWSYSILNAETIPYDSKWRIRLSQLRKQTPAIYAKTDTFYGLYLGSLVNQFIKKYNAKVDLICSHGHTVFHQPDSGFTAQVGAGSSIHASTGLPVVSDFRTVDVALGGQGAPLVPVGDSLLFGEYDACLNLGGFCNISTRQHGKTAAFDICPGNIVLNRIARNLGKDFDENGEIALSGGINYDLLKKLNEIDFYTKTGPKSLGREWINSVFWPIVRDFEKTSKQEDLMKTLADHIAGQISKTIDALTDNQSENYKVLVTGGGAYNEALIDLLRTHSDAQFIIPQDKNIVEYKEALIFALLGLLRVKNQVNVLAEATGSKADNIGGALYGNFSALV
jgi:anhydro-N-acetylmuramic acid kinase